MASAARSAADRLTAQESTWPRTPRGEAPMGRNPLRHPPEKLGSTAPQPPRGRIPQESRIGKAEPIYRMRSVGAPCSREPLLVKRTDAAAHRPATKANVGRVIGGVLTEKA